VGLGYLDNLERVFWGVKMTIRLEDIGSN